MVLPGEIYSDDYQAICYMANLISGESYRGNWTEISFSFTLNDNLKKKLVEIEESEYSISYVASSEISLYGEQYQFSIRRTHECVKIKNLERMKKKAEVLDVGDKIRIEYIPVDVNEIGFYLDNLYEKSSGEIM